MHQNIQVTFSFPLHGCTVGINSYMAVLDGGLDVDENVDWNMFLFSVFALHYSQNVLVV